MKILIVEDDESLALAIAQILNEQKYQTEIAYNGEDGLDYALHDNYDLILLDIMLPKLDGFSLVKKLRQNKNNSPIIMLTAKDDIHSKITGLDSGADDYITKPFVKEELLARIRANARRQGDVIINTLSFCDLNLDLDTAILSCNTKSIQLSFKEFSILKILLVHPNLVINKEVLIDKVWGNESEAEANNVEAYISFLRKKFQFIGTKVSINTLRRLGYRLEVKND
ncbi:MAG: response regulator transcription factor [Lachnospiraceae bacterium]|jgi:two component transcriptional regulator, winged helix family|nr:response regulator transcription factor [Lachnospiraceae bacterium]